jgi:hypothetical protein
MPDRDFYVRIITRTGSIIEKTVSTQSARSASDIFKKEYPGCKVVDVRLLKKNPKNIVIFTEGDQVEVDPKVLFQHKL